MNIVRWNKAMSAARMLTVDHHSAARITNLAIAAAAAHFLSHNAAEDFDSLETLVRNIALFPLPSLSKNRQKWRGFADVVKAVAARNFTPRDLDLWVEAWHSADPNRKTRGAYATPSVFANELASATLWPYLTRQFVRIIDPSAGAGALLLACFRLLSNGKTAAGRRKVLRGLYGIELDPVSRELCCLMLWLASGAVKDDLDLIAANIQVGDALTRDWWSSGKDAPFNALIMNPPWESLRHSIEETAPHAAA